MFDLFRLSRELRDQIYEELLMKQLDLRPPGNIGLRMRIKNAPSGDLLLVNRRFTNEYLDAVRRQSSITVVSSHHCEPREIPEVLKAVNIPSILRSTRRLDYIFWTHSMGKSPSQAFYDAAANAPMYNTRYHVALLRRLSSQMQDPNIFVVLGLNERPPGRCEWTKFVGHKKLVRSRGLRELLIRGGPQYYKESDKIRKPAVLAKYDPVTGAMVTLGSPPEGQTRWTISDFGYDDEDDRIDWRFLGDRYLPAITNPTETAWKQPKNESLDDTERR